MADTKKKKKAAVVRVTLPASVLNLVSLPVLASTVARRGEYILFFLERWDYC